MTEIQHGSIERTASGKVYIADNKDRQYLVNPGLVKHESTSNRTKPTNSNKESFKLVTVRKITTTTLTSLNAELKAQQEVLAAAALRSNQPVPFPSLPPTSEADLKEFYAIYVDEDLYGTKNPIYIFRSPSPKIKAFITANGSGKDDWSVHVFHLTNKEVNPDGTFDIKWRLYTIDNKLDQLNARVDYLLESSSLPSCFEANYDIENISYCGGGCWTGLAIDPKDRLPIIASAPTENIDKYIPIGQPLRMFGQGQTMAIVAYSVTPTYSFTWCRGKNVLNKRERSFNQKIDFGILKSDGVIETTRTHDYSLDLIYRPIMSDITKTIVENKKREYSSGSAIYVGNTNSVVASMYQTPDFGTDVRRLSIRQYNMSTNIIRPKTLTRSNTLPAHRISYQGTGLLPILCSSNNMSDFLTIDFGEAKGSINHPYEIKGGVAQRGYDYPDFYKNWWGYGRIVGFNVIGDGRYYQPKTAGTFPGTPSRFRIGSMFDLGELILDPDYPNAMKTTWNSLTNPQTGFFGIETGELKWTYLYLNPPLIGHNGIYYYEKNPTQVGVYGGYDRSFGSATSTNSAGFGNSFIGGSRESSAVSRQNELIAAYSAFAGALGGGGLTSLNIGSINIASSDGASVVVREPTSEMQAYLRSTPEIMPHGSGGFWSNDYVDIDLQNGLTGSKTTYNRLGEVIYVENI